MLHGKYKEDFNCRHCELAYKRVKELKEEIQFHNKENSNLLAERNAAQIGYDEIREVRERYRSVLEEIRGMFLNQVAWVGQLTNFEEEIYNKINEVLNA